MGVVAIAITLGLAACGGDEGAGQATPSSPTATNGTTTGGNQAGSLESVAWQGECGSEQVELDFAAPFVITDNAWRVVEPGTGEVIEPGTRIAALVVAYHAGSGEMEFSSAEAGKPEIIPLAGVGQAAADDPIYQALVGQKVGTCLIMALTRTDAAGEVDPTAGMVVAMTVTGIVTVLDRATGETVAQTDESLPKVSLAADGQPSIELPPSTDPPKNLVVQDLIKGAGQVVQIDQEITVHYAGWLWSDGTQFDSSWDRGSPATFELSVGQLIEGWTTGLVGQAVGSQVLLVVPPEMGYGSTDRGTIPPDSTLIFVIDILGAQ